MNKNEIIMKSKRLFAAFLMLFPWIPKASFAESLPVPRVKFPFDVSKRDSTVNHEIKIREYRSYYFAIQFDYFGAADMNRVRSLVGNGGVRPDGGYANPGIIVPIHIKLIRLESGKDTEAVYDGTVETQGTYAFGSGNFTRDIIIVDLKPGIYRVEASTIKDSPEFTGTPSHLLIEHHFQLKFIPHKLEYIPHS